LVLFKSNIKRLSINNAKISKRKSNTGFLGVLARDAIRELHPVYFGVFILLASFFFDSTKTYAQNNLRITIHKIENLEGAIFLHLSSDTSMFDRNAGKDGIVVTRAVEDSVMVVELKNISDGMYAFALFHDLNGNGKLDSRKFGIPAEPYAFSKNAKGKFGPPKFTEASFMIDGGKTHMQEVDLIFRKPKKKSKGIN
jgi:uncharacterized protein (DUF2141 family)